MTIHLNPGDSINLTTRVVTNRYKEALSRNDLNAFAYLLGQR